MAVKSVGETRGRGTVDDTVTCTVAVAVLQKRQWCGSCRWHYDVVEMKVLC